MKRQDENWSGRLSRDHQYQYFKASTGCVLHTKRLTVSTCLVYGVGMQDWWSMVVAPSCFRLLFFCWNCGFSQGGGNYEHFQISPLIQNPKHTSKSTNEWLHRKKRKLKFRNDPARAQIYIQYKICDLKRAVCKRCPHNLTDLERFCERVGKYLQVMMCNADKTPTQQDCML